MDKPAYKVTDMEYCLLRAVANGRPVARGFVGFARAPSGYDGDRASTSIPLQLRPVVAVESEVGRIDRPCSDQLLWLSRRKGNRPAFIEITPRQYRAPLGVDGLIPELSLTAAGKEWWEDQNG